jgi:outer membrane protein TolC
LDDTIRQQVQSLARTFLNIDASEKQLRTAKRLKAAAAARLDAQRANYAEGRITIDRFLDAVSQYATAVATEAQCKATYNTSIVALKEAKGTLLEDYGIVVAEPRRRRKANQ